jgi:hypothetical protein
MLSPTSSLLVLPQRQACVTVAHKLSPAAAPPSSMKWGMHLQGDVFQYDARTS